MIILNGASKYHTPGASVGTAVAGANQGIPRTGRTRRGAVDQNRTLSPTCPRRVSPRPLRSVPSKLNSRDPTAVST